MSTIGGSDRAATPSRHITYAEFWKRLEKHLTDNGRQSVVANYRTTLNAFKSVHRRTDTSLVHADFDGDFDQRRDEFIEAQRRDGIKPSTYHSRSSHLKAFKEFHEREIAPSELPFSFNQALRKLLKDRGYTTQTFYTKFLVGKCGNRTLYKWWTSKITPSAKSLPLIEEIEHILGVEKGTLVNRLPRKLKGRDRRKSGQTLFGAKMVTAVRKRYGVWTGELEAEWAGLEAYKLSAPLSEEYDQLSESGWTTSFGSKGELAPTAEKIKSNLRLFFGYCCLPKHCDDPYLTGRGMKPEELTIALLAEKDVVRGYLAFQRVRAGGKYNRGSIDFLITAASLLRPRTGYLYLYPNVAQRLNKSITPSTWRRQCVATRKQLSNMAALLAKMKRKGQKKYYQMGRDPKEPIKEILGSPRPLFPVLQMIIAMLQALPPEGSSPVERAVHFRDTLFIALLSANPLRVRQFAIMEFDRHLVRHRDGSWWLQFEKGEFKNRQSLDCDYCVRVAENIWPLIERYRREFRPLLAGADSCQYVFRPCGSGRHSKESTAPMSESSLYRSCVDVTYLYLDGCSGVGPHGFRHIVATDLIKTDPRYGFFLAAKALHDRLETVERDYGHLKTSELFEPYNEHYAEALQAVAAEGGKS